MKYKTCEISFRFSTKFVRNARSDDSLSCWCLHVDALPFSGRLLMNSKRLWLASAETCTSKDKTSDIMARTVIIRMGRTGKMGYSTWPCLIIYYFPSDSNVWCIDWHVSKGGLTPAKAQPNNIHGHFSMFLGYSLLATPATHPDGHMSHTIAGSRSLICQ